MEKTFCYCLLDLISQQKEVTISEIIDKAKNGKIAEFILNLNKDWPYHDGPLCDAINNSVKDYDFDVIEKCGINQDSNGLIQLLALIINYEKM